MIVITKTINKKICFLSMLLFVIAYSKYVFGFPVFLCKNCFNNFSAQ